MQKKIRISALDFWAFLSILFVGADKIGLNVGYNFRLDQIFWLMLFATIILEKSFIIPLDYPMLFFLIASFLSTLCACDMTRGMIYYINICFNIFVVFFSTSLYIKKQGIEKFTELYRYTMYIQFALILLQEILGLSGRTLFGLQDSGYWYGVLRIPLWFYEPSYLATYLIIWFTFSIIQFFCYQERGYLKDIIMSAIGIVLSTSTAGYLGVVVAVLFTYIIWLSDKRITFGKFIVIPIYISLFALFSKTNFYKVFVGRIFTQGFDVASGNRTALWSETWNVFLEKPILGVGPGCYGLWLHREAGYVPSNVTLELLATLGIIGGITFFILHFHLIKLLISNTRRTYLSRYGVGFATSLIVFLIVLQANQNYLRLYHWMLLGVLFSGIYLKNIDDYETAVS